MFFNRSIYEVVDRIFILKSIVLINLVVDFKGRDVSLFQLVHTFLLETRLKDCLPFLQFMLIHGLKAHEFIYNCR